MENDNRSNQDNPNNQTASNNQSDYFMFGEQQPSMQFYHTESNQNNQSGNNGYDQFQDSMNTQSEGSGYAQSKDSVNGQSGNNGYIQSHGNGNTQFDNSGYAMQDRGYHKKNPKKEFTWKKGVVITACVVLFGVATGGAFFGIRQISGRLLGNTTAETGNKSKQKKSLDVEKSSELATVTTSESSAATENDVSKVVKNVMPAIVSINNTYTETADSYFFGRYEQENEGSGSGIIIGQNSSEVLIATNNHVIDGKNAKIKVTFYDDTQADASIKGTDSSNDLAVVAVKISSLSDETKEKIKIATLGDSDKTEVGEMSIAIGNALGYGQSVTVGYISAKEREILIDDCTLTLLQTDAAINPGNSGGALLNAKGEVIAINSAKFSDTDIEGMGYAIPISTAIPIINELMNREQLAESEQAYLGVKGVGTESYRSQFNMPAGIFVKEISDGSPADKGGIRQGDIITEIDGKKITTMQQLKSFLSYTQAGTKVTITLQRMSNGSYQEKEVSVTLGSRSDSDSSSRSDSSDDSEEYGIYQNPYSPYDDGLEDDYDNPYNWFFPQ